MHRRIATHLATLIVGAGFGLGAVAVASPESPRATSSATDKKVVGQLRKTNATLGSINRKLDDLDGLRTANEKLDRLNQSVGGYASLAGVPSLRAVLQDIERNTSP